MNNSSKNIFSKFGHIAILILVTILCYLPFINKAVHVDDPLFIWTAQHIQQHPYNPYDFNVNWYGRTMPMYEVTKNPPLTSYYIAGVASFFGWSEQALHLAFLLPLLGLIIGTYLLALHFCSRPFDASLIALLTPVVLLSATTLMCDVLMLCSWVWAMMLWIKGIQAKNRSLLFISAFLITCSALTKYFGINLILLLIIWTIVERRRLDSSILFLLFPAVILASYHWITFVLYGKGLLIDAASYAVQFGSVGSKTFLSKFLIGFAFTGGCFVIILFYLHRLWNTVIFFVNVIITIALVFLLIKLGTIGKITLADADGVRWGYVLQFSGCAIAGINLIFLAIVDIFQKRDADSLLIFLWIIGTFLFAVLINWSINGRTLLPLAPAVGILIVRRIESTQNTRVSGSVWKKYIPLAFAGLLALIVTYSDYNLANTIRDDAAHIVKLYKSPNSTIWFQGHWGFQYYMESFGCKPLDPAQPNISSGDIIVNPLNNTNLYRLPGYMPLRDSLESKTFTWLTCMNKQARAGFYSDVWGPLPFVFGTISPERYNIHISQKELHSR
jgi:4-amino-4-deoxy-L-arabinose transferase-like glycosyltransferase